MLHSTNMDRTEVKRQLAPSGVGERSSKDDRARARDERNAQR